MIDKELISDFSNIIGKIEIIISLSSCSAYKERYEVIKKELIRWIEYYYTNKKLDIISYNKSLEIHEDLLLLKGELLMDDNVGMESLLSDDILIRYEVIMKKINNLMGYNNELR